MATREVPIVVHSTARVTVSKFGEFTPVIGVTGSTLHVLETKANHSNSMEFLEKAGLRPLKYQEALQLLMNDETLKNSLKGKWFYIEGKGLDKKLELYTIAEKGELAETKADVSIERTVRVWNGPHPLSLGVNSDFAAVYGGRFGLGADDVSRNVAPVVVGVPKLEPKLSQAEPASPIGSMLRKGKNTVLEVTTDGGITYDLPSAVSVKVKETKTNN